MQKNFTKEEDLAAVLATSDRIHKKEMRALASEVTRIRRVYIKLHGGLPPAHHARKALL
jgi:hypothetical protein